MQFPPNSPTEIENISFFGDGSPPYRSQAINKGLVQRCIATLIIPLLYVQDVGLIQTMFFFHQIGKNYEFD